MWLKDLNPSKLMFIIDSDDKIIQVVNKTSVQQNGPSRDFFLTERS